MNFVGDTRTRVSTMTSAIEVRDGMRNRLGCPIKMDYGLVCVADSFGFQ